MRTCTKCGSTKPMDQFHVDVGATGGRSARCAECAKVKARQWNTDNRERKAAARAAYYADPKNLKNKQAHDRKLRAENVEARRAADRKYAAENSARAVNRVKIWREANPEIARFKRKVDGARRRAMLLKACPSWADHNKIAAVYALSDRLTKETGTLHAVDHVIPLLGRNVCGLHVPENLRAITAHENQIKSGKLIPELADLAIRLQITIFNLHVLGEQEWP